MLNYFADKFLSEKKKKVYVFIFSYYCSCLYDYVCYGSWLVLSSLKLVFILFTKTYFALVV